MAKYDVYRADAGTYLLDCQTDLLSGLNTRLVVPLMPPKGAPVAGARLNPTFDIEGITCSMVTQYAAVVLAIDLRDFVMSLEAHDLAIDKALDVLISGV